MSRHPRQLSKSGIYHVIIRGNNKQNIFLDDNDRKLFIKKMYYYAKQEEIKILAYCLLNNHVHILVGNATTTLSKFMLRLNTSYSRLFNIKYDRTGHLFQGRFLSTPIETNEKFKITIRYILKNSDKKNTGKYIDYKWSNYKNLTESSYSQNKFIFDIFHSKKEFINYISEKIIDINFDYDTNIRFSDKQALKLIKKLLKIDDPTKLLQYDKNTLVHKIKILKKHKLSQNQISRITGVSRKIIRLA